MSGHSKWSQIKRQKGVQDQKRGVLFTKLGKAITLAARQGGGDIAANFKLRLAVDIAKSANMPKANIARAIKRGLASPAGGGRGELQESTYEAFGPGGVAILIKTLSDNKNRTASELKHILTKHQGSLGSPGSVSWQFKDKGIIRLKKAKQAIEVLTLQAIDLGAEEVIEATEEIVVETSKDNLEAVKDGLAAAGVSVAYAGLELVPDNLVAVDAKLKSQLEKLFADLDANQAVSDYYHNAKLS